MDRYKVKLQYYNNEILLSEYDSVDVIVNAEDFELSFARQTTYEGLFMEMTDSIQFIESDKDYINSVFDDWKTRLSSEYFLQINIDILDKNLLTYETVFVGIADWEDFKKEENVAEVLFSEKSATKDLLESEDINVSVIPTPLSRYVNYKSNDYLNTAIRADYKVLDNSGFGTKNTGNLGANTYIEFSLSLPENISLTNQVSFEKYNLALRDASSSGVVSTLYHRIDGTNVNIVSNAYSMIVTLNSTESITVVLASYVYLKSRKTSEYVLILIESKTSVNSTNQRQLDYLAINQTIDLDTYFTEEDQEAGVDVYVGFKGSLASGISIDFDVVQVRNDGDFNISYGLDIPDYDLRFKPATISSIVAAVNPNIDYTWFFNSDYSNILLLNKVSIFDDISQVAATFNFSFKDIFAFIKTVAFAGIRLDNVGNLHVDSLDNIYNQESTIINLGEATGLVSSLNDEFLTNKIEIGSTTEPSEGVLVENEYNILREFKLNNGIKNDFRLLIDKIRVDSTWINQYFIELFQGSYTEDNNNDEVFAIFTDTETDLVQPPTLVNNVSDNFGFAFNIEFSVYNLIKKWRNYLSVFLTNDNDLSITKANKNKDVTFTDTEISQVVNDVKKFTKSDSPFNGKQNQIFGIEKYTIKVPIAPNLYKTIKEFHNNRYKVNYKGVDYIFFLRNIKINLLNDSLATIKGWQSESFAPKLDAPVIDFILSPERDILTGAWFSVPNVNQFTVEVLDGNDLVVATYINSSVDLDFELNNASEHDQPMRFRVKATAGGYIDSDFNTSTSITVLPLVTQLQAPVNVVASSAIVGEIDGTWDVVPNKASYNVSVFDNNNIQIGSTINVVNEVVSVSNLENETQPIYFKVNAISGSSNYTDSELATSNTVDVSSPKLATPTNLQVSNPVAGQFKGTWDAVLNAEYYSVIIYNGYDELSYGGTFTDASREIIMDEANLDPQPMYMTVIAKSSSIQDSDVATSVTITII